MPINCKCRREAQEELKILEEKKELERKLDKFKRYSLVDEKFLSSTFENWETKEDNESLKKLGQSYCNDFDKMLENNRGLLLHGKAGNGKTYLSFAIANELYKRGHGVLAISVSRLLKIITDSYNTNSNIKEIEMLSAISQAKLLILDDLGTENKTHWSYEKLYSIIDERYRARKPIIITTNFNLEELRANLSIVDNKKVAFDSSDRIYNRIIEMCAIVEVNGSSWRTKKGESNTRDLFKDLNLYQN